MAARLGVVVSHPIQYHSPLYRLLSSRTDISLEVLFLSRHGVTEAFDPGFQTRVRFDTDLLSGYRYQFLSNLSPLPSVNRAFGLINPQLLRRVHESNYDVVLVHGYAHLSDWLTFAAATSRRLPFMLRGESRVDTGMRGPGMASAMRRYLLRRLTAKAAVCLAIGSMNRRFYRSLGVPSDKIVHAPYSVDNRFFETAAKAGRERRGLLLSGMGLEEDRLTILFAAKLQPWKRPQDLLDLSRELPDANVLVVGDGPLRKDLERAAASCPNLRVLGFLNQGELGALYGVADAFVLPSSHEPWGLAVNEAMAAGAVPFVSSAVGCGPDLVQGGPGRIFPVGDVSALARAISEVFGDFGGDQRDVLSSLARERVAQFDISVTAEGIAEGSRLAVAGT